MEGGRKARLTRMGRPPCSVDRREGGGASEAEGRALEALRWLGAWDPKQSCEAGGTVAEAFSALLASRQVEGGAGPA